MKRAFLALKFHGGAEDQKQVEELTGALEAAGLETFVVVRDIEHYGKTRLPKGARLMPDYAFPALRESDLFVVEFSEKGVGLGIGAGYAYALGKPIYVIAKTGSEISLTMQSLATRVIFYDRADDLTAEFRALVPDTKRYDGVQPELQDYVMQQVTREYALNGPAHQMGHIHYGIRRSLKFAQDCPEANLAMVYTVAAFHDTMYHLDRKRHEILSAARLRVDEGLRRFFTEDEIETMAQAIEDHRGSKTGEPRSIYGKIVSSADRNTSLRAALERSYQYRLEFEPQMNTAERIEDARLHLLNKFGPNGYAVEKMYFPDPEYERFLRELTELASQPEKFEEEMKKVNGVE